MDQSGKAFAGEPTDLDAKALGLRVELRPVGESCGRRIKEPKQAAWRTVVDLDPRLGRPSCRPSFARGLTVFMLELFGRGRDLTLATSPRYYRIGSRDSGRTGRKARAACVPPRRASLSSEAIRGCFEAEAAGYP